jgi:hypothetical protein
MRKEFITTLAAAAAALSGICSVKAQQTTVSAVKVGHHIDVTIGNKFFTSYICNPDEKYPLFFPVNSPLSGGSVTSMRNGDYPHHSSLFFGCDRVNGGNYWQEDLSRGQIASLGARIIEPKGERVVIEDRCIWKRPDAQPPIIDRRKITISSPAASIFRIDFDIELEMLMDVVIEKNNHSLFSARIAPDLSVKQGGTMINAAGNEGEKATFGVASPWIDCSGKRAPGVEGIAILQHPSNPGFPTQWFTRDYGFFSPTPMFWPTDGKATSYKKGEVLKLRYRVLVHAGDAKQAEIEKEFANYSKE